jgi:hypothetical protein
LAFARECFGTKSTGISKGHAKATVYYDDATNSAEWAREEVKKNAHSVNGAVSLADALFRDSGNVFIWVDFLA